MSTPIKNDLNSTNQYNKQNGDFGKEKQKNNKQNDCEYIEALSRFSHAHILKSNFFRNILKFKIGTPYKP